MPYRRLLNRSFWATLLVLSGLVWSSLPVHSGAGAEAAGTTRFAGQIADVAGPVAAPTGFVLQFKDRFVEMHTSAKATSYRAKSAEAEVEGLLPGDYAVVLARHLKKGWTAALVTFDVRPLANLRPQLLLVGTVMRVAPNGQQFTLRLEGGGTRGIKILPRTKFFLDGQAIDSPPALAKGTVVQVVLRKSASGWFAFLINLKTGPSVRQVRLAR